MQHTEQLRSEKRTRSFRSFFLTGYRFVGRRNRTMDVIIFENEAYFRLQRELIRMFQKALEESDAKRDVQDWISEKEASTILPYRSKKKWAQLRETGKIRFMQIGRKICYSRKSILQFMDKNSLK